MIALTVGVLLLVGGGYCEEKKLEKRVTSGATSYTTVVHGPGYGKEPGYPDKESPGVVVRPVALLSLPVKGYGPGYHTQSAYPGPVLVTRVLLQPSQVQKLAYGGYLGWQGHAEPWSGSYHAPQRVIHVTPEPEYPEHSGHSYNPHPYHHYS